MKKLLPCLFSLVATQDLYWTWIDGSSGVNQPGNYVIKGLPSPNVFPGARVQHNGVLHPLTDEFVVFGGSDFVGHYNQLWTYSFTSNMWTWLSGSNSTNEAGKYGIKGTSSASNYPGSRFRASMDIDPTSGMLFMFGGFGFDSSAAYGYLNDLWRFDFNSTQWTWMSGSDKINQRGIYGNKASSTFLTLPGGREAHSFCFIPQTRNALLFGGMGYGTTLTPGHLNDLWLFNRISGFWAWMSGTSTTNHVGQVTIGVEPNSAIPRGRSGHSYTMNKNNGVLFIQGGTISMTEEFNDDLWSYDYRTNQWTWLSGSRIKSAVYGQKGIPSANNTPGTRFYHHMSYVSSLNSLILFGGFEGDNYYNDLWMFNVTANQWTWEGGSNFFNQPSVYGKLGIPSYNNTPGGCFGAAFDCADKLRKCVLYGGAGSPTPFSDSLLNDIWTLDYYYPISNRSSSRLSPTMPSFFSSSSPLRSQFSRSSSVPTSSSSRSQWSRSTSSPQLPTTHIVVETLTTSTAGPAEIELSSSSFSTETTSYSSDIESILSLELDSFPSTVNLSTSKTSTRLPTSDTQTEADKILSFIRSNQTFLLFGISFFVFLLVLTAFIRCLKKQSIAEIEMEESKSVYSETTSSSYTFTTTNQTTTDTMTITQVPTNQGISIPGFIQFRFGEDFRIIQEIAYGGMGLVCLAEAFHPSLRQYGNKFIVKKILKPILNARDINVFHQEVSIMYYLREHKNIAKIIGYTEEPYSLCMKIYPYGSLDTWIKSRQTLKTRSILLNLLLDVANGVSEMHRQSLVHCDLKPQNILLDWDENRLFCVLTDFGITQIVSAQNLLVMMFQAVNVRGASIQYASPEAIRRLRKRKEAPGNELFTCDIYAIGIIMFEMINRIRPWQ